MKRIFIYDGPTDVPKYERNLLSFGETRNMKFNRCFFKSFHWVMLAFWQIDMCNDWKNQLSAAPSASDFQKVYLRSIPCCNNCQVNLFLFQRLDIMFILSSSPKVGICSKRSNLHISSFLRFVPVLWIIDKHCNNLMEPATNKYVGHTSAIN